MQHYSHINNPLISFQFPEIKSLLQHPASVDLPNYDTRYNILDAFRIECKSWLQHGSNTKITGLDEFPYVYMLSGISHYISDLPKIENRTIVMHKREYGAYKQTLELFNKPFRLEDSYNTLDHNNANEFIITSFPVSLNANYDIDAEYLIKTSRTPICIDGAFLGTNLFPVNLNFSQMPNVETFVYSFSKLGLAYNRIGIMFTKKLHLEYELYQSHGYVNLYSAQLARKLMAQYHIDYFTEKYRKVHKLACDHRGFSLGDCLLIGRNNNIADADNKAKIWDLFDDIIAGTIVP
jgi:hypothetical protein